MFKALVFLQSIADWSWEDI